MRTTLRALARRLLGVERTPTYYLPWLTRPGLECTVLVNNIEARFKTAANRGPFPVSAVQYDANGTPVRRFAVTLTEATDVAELRMEPAAGECGFVAVDAGSLHSDLLVALSTSEFYTATHGRGEFVERYPPAARALATVLGGLLALAHRTVPAFTRDQYVYGDAESRAHLLLMNLSNVTNRIRVSAPSDATFGARLVALPPMGSRLVDLGASSTPVRRLRLSGNAWFNLYVVGAGARGLTGPLSLMHVK
jgi:hypothetical protein